MIKPDNSLYLAHFTKTRKGNGAEISPLEILLGILKEKTIRASNMNWTNVKAVCFTECPWGSLIEHAGQYSAFGNGFTKEAVFRQGGNPVFYIRPDLYNSGTWSEPIHGFMTPYVPSFTPKDEKGKHPFDGKTIDYVHEREWRTLNDFKFEYHDIEFIAVGGIKDAERIAEEFPNEIDIEKIIPIDTYRTIERLWPTHILPKESKL